jgi:hypothetical protein
MDIDRYIRIHRRSIDKGRHIDKGIDLNQDSDSTCYSSDDR